MPRLLRKFLGLILLITTIGLSTCQSMIEAAPIRANAVDLADVARMELAESGVNRPANAGLRYRFVQATCHSGVKSTVLPVRADYPAGLSATAHPLERGRY